MRKYGNLKTWFTAFLLLIFSAGCSDYDKSGSNPTVTPPTVTSAAPLNASITACPNTTVTATFSVAMNPATINGTTFTLTGPGTTPVTGVVTYDAPSNTATFTPSSALALSTPYTATITTGATDAYGIALASNFVWTFTTRATPCLVPAPPTSVTPPNGSGGICPNTIVAATFPQAMDPATINTTTFTVTPGVTGTVTSDVTNTIFTFTPSSNLALSNVYTATITTGATDSFGNALASNYVWTFTTAAASCTAPPVPPAVISVAPPSSAGSICPNTIVTATFSEAMNPATIIGATFTLTGPGTAAVAGVVSYDASSDTAIFTPASSLALSTLYTATITTGAQDTFANALASNVVWTFATGANPCLPPAPPITVTPAIGSGGICPNTVVAATFPQAMNPTTIDPTTFTLTGPGTTPVTGTVTPDGTNKIFTFTPASSLAGGCPLIRRK